MKFIKNALTNDKVKGSIAIVAAIIMYYTPDHIDALIQGLLSMYGITVLTLGKPDGK
jgi:hypothetical protein